MTGVKKASGTDEERMASAACESVSEPDGHSQDTRLSILRVATDLYPDITGGGAIHAHAMSKRQAEQGHDVTVLTSDHGDSEKPTVERRDGYTVVRHRQIVRLFGNSITPGIVSSLLRRVSDIDVVHAHSHLYFTANVASLVAKLADVPLVVTNHGLISQTAPEWVQRVFIPTVGRFTFNASDRVLCYTETDRQRLRERDIITPIEVINNGINCQRFTPGDDANERRLLFVGRLTDGKGLPILLDAFARLAASYPDLELRVVGDGPNRTSYERRCERLGIADRIRFIGDISYDEMPRHYRESTVFVLPSHSEGLPRTVLEAMACETPVVTTALPQLEPVVDGAGYTVERGSVSGFVSSIAELLKDRATRREFGRHGRQQVLEANAWNRTVEETTDVLSELADP